MIKSFIKKIISDINKNKIKKIKYNDLEINYSNPNWLTNYRIKTFSTKEPETLKWIDSFEEKSVFYDIGANIGLYSIYSSLKKNTQTFSFEPSVFNIEELVKNIVINNLNELITVIPLPLSNKTMIDNFNYSDSTRGSAHSAFGVKYDQYGKDLNIKSFYKVLGIKLDDLINLYKLDYPDYIKIDVDGIEHLILEGSQKSLKNTKSILVEITNTFKEQRERCCKILEDNKFKMNKKISESNDNLTQNQIWTR